VLRIVNHKWTYESLINCDAWLFFFIENLNRVFVAQDHLQYRVFRTRPTFAQLSSKQGFAVAGSVKIEQFRNDALFLADPDVFGPPKWGLR